MKSCDESWKSNDGAGGLESVERCRSVDLK